MKCELGMRWRTLHPEERTKLGQASGKFGAGTWSLSVPFPYGFRPFCPSAAAGGQFSHKHKERKAAQRQGQTPAGPQSARRAASVRRWAGKS